MVDVTSIVVVITVVDDPEPWVYVIVAMLETTDVAYGPDAAAGTVEIPAVPMGVAVVMPVPAGTVGVMAAAIDVEEGATPVPAGALEDAAGPVGYDPVPRGALEAAPVREGAMGERGNGTTVSVVTAGAVPDGDGAVVAAAVVETPACAETGEG